MSVIMAESIPFDENSTLSSGIGESIDNLSSVDSFNGILSEEIVMEERNLEQMSLEEMKKIKKDHIQKELTEKRYEGLLELLEKSQFYANFALKKLEHMEASVQSSSGNKQGKKRKANDKIFGVTLTEGLVNAVKGQNASSNCTISQFVQHDYETRVTELGVEVPECQPLLLTGACLRKYQIEGLEWMKRLYLAGLNGILADEMGLGKTIQTIALICHMYEIHNSGPFLIVAPLSTLPNWMMEFENFAPDIPTVLYHGNDATRKSLQKKISQKKKVLGKPVFPVVITSYQVPLKDERFLNNFLWKFLIVDEGHKLKNHMSGTSRCLSRLTSVNRLLLTGTPLQNELKELWSLLHFLIPDIFHNLDDFSSWFQVEEFKQSENASCVVKKEKDSQILTKLHDVVAPFLLRRLKGDVKINLPPKKEIFIYCPLSDLQYSLYSWIVNEAIKLKEKKENEPTRHWRLLGVDWEIVKRQELEQTSESEIDMDPPLKKRRCVVAKMPLENSYKMISPVKSAKYAKTEDDLNVFHFQGQSFKIIMKMANPIMVLRKAANHPYLIEAPDHAAFSYTSEQLIKKSGKMLILDNLLRKLKAGKHKVLIFSCFTSTLDLIEDCMEYRNYEYVRLDGRSSLENRKVNISAFNSDPKIFVFLASTRAGGLGINLPSADTVIFYDSDWNPQADLQAQDRCHRIGQTKPVIVYRLISEGTIDEEIVTRAEAKRKLEKVIIGAGRFGYCSSGVRDSRVLDLENLKSLLEQKQHNAELKAEGQVLTDEQWEVLLKRDFS